jgi:hypothetical protein
MGFFSRLLGTENEPRARYQQGNIRSPAQAAGEQAIQRYRYMVQTAPPETLEQAHAEAFAKLTPEQRRLLVQGLAQTAPPEERAAIEGTSSDDPRGLARIATRAEIRQPGVTERALSQPGLGLGGSLFSSFAAGFVGSLVAQSFFSTLSGFGDAGAEDASASANEGPADTEVDGEDDLGVGDLGGDDFSGGGDFGSDL